MRPKVMTFSVCSSFMPLRLQWSDGALTRSWLIQSVWTRSQHNDCQCGPSPSLFAQGVCFQLQPSCSAHCQGHLRLELWRLPERHVFGQGRLNRRGVWLLRPDLHLTWPSGWGCLQVRRVRRPRHKPATHFSDVPLAVVEVLVYCAE